MRSIALVLAAAGCFSEPARPHGEGLPIAAVDRDRALAIGGYGVAVAAAITGLVLRHHHREAPNALVTTTPGGAAVWLRWER